MHYVILMLNKCYKAILSSPAQPDENKIGPKLAKTFFLIKWFHLFTGSHFSRPFQYFLFKLSFPARQQWPQRRDWRFVVAYLMEEPLLICLLSYSSSSSSSAAAFSETHTRPDSKHWLTSLWRVTWTAGPPVCKSTSIYFNAWELLTKEKDKELVLGGVWPSVTIMWSPETTSACAEDTWIKRTFLLGYKAHQNADGVFIHLIRHVGAAVTWRQTGRPKEYESRKSATLQLCAQMNVNLKVEIILHTQVHKSGGRDFSDLHSRENPTSYPNTSQRSNFKPPKHKTTFRKTEPLSEFQIFWQTSHLV